MSPRGPALWGAAWFVNRGSWLEAVAVYLETRPVRGPARLMLEGRVGGMPEGGIEIVWSTGGAFLARLSDGSVNSGGIR